MACDGSISSKIHCTSTAFYLASGTGDWATGQRNKDTGCHTPNKKPNLTHRKQTRLCVASWMYFPTFGWNRYNVYWHFPGIDRDWHTHLPESPRHCQLLLGQLPSHHESPLPRLAGALIEDLTGSGRFRQAPGSRQLIQNVTMILVIWQLLFIIHNIYIYMKKIMSIYVYIYMINNTVDGCEILPEPVGNYWELKTL